MTVFAVAEMRALAEVKGPSGHTPWLAIDP